MLNPKELPKPRKPNQQELAQLAAWVRADDHQADAEMALAMAFIAVFDDYTTFYPGFVGKILVVVWGLAPSAYQVFTWGNELIPAEQRRGKIAPLNQAEDFRVMGADDWS